MVRALITITDKDKEWLNRYSDQHRQSRAETVRRAIEYFREKTQKKSYQEVLKETSGLWKGRKINSLKFVENIRQEWEERSK